MRVIATITKYAYVLGKMSAARYNYCVTIYIYLYNIIDVFYITVFIYAHMLPVMSYFYTGTSVCLL